MSEILKEPLPVPTKKTAPCKDCEEREVKCHGKCERFKAWNEKHVADREAIRKKKNAIRDVDDYVQKNIIKYRKTKGHWQKKG